MPTSRQKWLIEVKCVNNGHRFKTPVLHKREGVDVEEPGGREVWVVVTTEGIYCREPRCCSRVEAVETVTYV